MALIQETPFMNPYYINTRGKQHTSFELLCRKCHQCGVYVIREKDTKDIIYVGYSENNLYRTLYRHFQHWDSKEDRAGNWYRNLSIDRNTHEVKIFLSSSGTARELEKVLIQKYRPVENKEMYDPAKEYRLATSKSIKEYEAKLRETEKLTKKQVLPDNEEPPF